MTEYESNLAFDFSEDQVVSKFDDEAFYRDLFNAMPGGKAVDFLAASGERYVFLEVKNCAGDEANNRWRIDPDNRKRDTVPGATNVAGRDSLDIEVAQKVAMTISALFGAYTCPTPRAKAEECTRLAGLLFDGCVRSGRRRLIVILLLDGEFGCYTRSDNMIRMQLQKSIARKLKWLNCTVLVTESKDFPAEALHIRVSRAAG